ncbi:MAG: Panacea domain-containing protein [Chloroflexota bacterium]|nr:Panacea domain-containing protein [Chloroflexota bacterium]MDE2894379.1 Panacea domain-containing protein [Chloroflexota bacterium]
MTKIRYFFDEERARQAAVYLLREEVGGAMAAEKVNKLLYLADRSSLAEDGRPITGDRYLAEENGPVLEQIRSRLTDGSWEEWIGKDELGHLQAKGDGSFDLLSEFDKIQLRVLATQWRSQDWREISEFTHGLDEWNTHERQSGEISPEAILRATIEGISDETLEALANSAEMDRGLRDQAVA